MEVKVKEELRKGLEAAIQLRILLAESQLNSNSNSNERLMGFMRDYSSFILKTFDTAISVLKSTQHEFMAPDFHGNDDDDDDKGSSKQHTILSCKRSYYNRRTIEPEPVKVINATVVTEDGYTWRKYGQKPIVNKKHPREYYGCGYKDQGCKAKKQVQMITENPSKYRILYYGLHTCQPLLFNQTSSLLDSINNEKESQNMLSFNESCIHTSATSNSKHDEVNPSVSVFVSVPGITAKIKQEQQTISDEIKPSVSVSGSTVQINQEQKTINDDKASVSVPHDQSTVEDALWWYPCMFRTRVMEEDCSSFMGDWSDLNNGGSQDFKLWDFN